MKGFLFVTLFCSPILLAQSYHNNRLLNGLKGDVLRVKAEAWSPDPNDSTQLIRAESGLPYESDYTFYFDTDGNRYYALYADETGENEEIFLNFDSLNRIISRRSGMLSGGGPVSQTDYYFDASGHLAKETIRTDSAIIEERYYENDRYGRVIAETITPDSDSMKKRTVYSTDHNGILSKIVYATDSYGREYEETIQRWDTLGREIYYSLQGGAESRPRTEVFYIWNEKNQLVQFVQPFQFGAEQRQCYFYDADGNETEVYEYGDEKLISITRMQYNYDQYRNWVEQEVWKDDVLQYVIRRKIIYETGR